MIDAATTRDPFARRPIDYVLAFGLGLISLAATATLIRTVAPGYLAFSDCTPYLVQAHIFSEGRLTRRAPDPDMVPFFSTVGMLHYEGREFSRQPPGASAAFALLLPIVRDVRLAPCVLTSVAVVLNVLWIGRIFGRKTAVLGGLICLAAPYYLILGSSALSYVPSAMFFSAVMLCCVSILRSPGWAPACLCGLFVGLQFVARPYTAILTGVWLVLCRWVIFRAHPGKLRQSLAFALGALPGVVLLLIHNRMVVGRWIPLAFTLYEPRDRLGFGLRGLGPVTVEHTPMRALSFLGEIVPRVPPVFLVMLTAWLVPLVAWWLARALRRRRSEWGKLLHWDWALLLFVVIIVVGHMAYWWPRLVNYFESYPLLAALSARGYVHIAGRRFMRLPTALALVLIVLACPLLIKIWHTRQEAAIAVALTVQDQVNRSNSPLLLFVNASGRSLGHSIPGVYSEDAVTPGLFNMTFTSESPVLYAVDSGPKNLTLATRYPDRRPYILTASYGEARDATIPKPLLVPLSDYLRGQ